MITKFYFHGFTDYEDGQMAQLETTGEYHIPVNIFIDNADEIKIADEDPCQVDVCGVGSNFSIYASEQDYRMSDHKMALISLIPTGTFPLNPDDEKFNPSPYILFSGIVQSVEWNPSAADNEPNCCVIVETLEVTFSLYFRSNSPIEPGNIIHGAAWLYGDMKQVCP